MEAAPKDTTVEDFEIGVFCGRYKTEVPDGYFEHLDELRGCTHRHQINVADPDGPILTGNASSMSSQPRSFQGRLDLNGLVAGANSHGKGDVAGTEVVRGTGMGPMHNPENREDISIHNLANDPMSR